MVYFLIVCIKEKLKNVTKTFDDLFGSDVAEESKKEKIVYNKDSDESEGEPEVNRF